MVQKITLDMENRTGGPLNELKRDLNQAATATDNLGKELVGTDKSMEDLVLGVRQAAGELKGLKDHLVNTQKEADDLRKKNEAMGKQGSMIGSLSSRFLAVGHAIQWAGQAAKGAYEIIQHLAENGSPAFKRMTEAINEAGNALVGIANDPLVQDWTDQVTAGFKEHLLPVLKDLPGTVRSIQDSIADWLVDSGERIGVFAEGTRASLEELQAEQAKVIKQRQEAFKEEQRLAEVAKQQATIQRNLQAIETSRLIERYNLQLKNAKTENQLNAEYRTQIAYQKELASLGLLSKDRQEIAAKKLNSLEARRTEIIAEQKEAAKAAAEAQVQKYQEQWEKAKELAEKQVELERMKNEKIKAEQDKLLAEQAAKWKAHVEKLRGLLSNTEKTGAVDQGLSGDNFGAVDRLAKDRTKKAQDEINKRFDEKKANAPVTTQSWKDVERQRNAALGKAARTIRASTFGQARRQGIIKGSTRDAQRVHVGRSKGIADRARQAARAETQSKRQAAAGMQNPGGGQISASDLAKSQGDNLAAFLRNAESRGQLDRQTVQASAEQAKTLINLSQEQEALAKQVDSVVKLLQGQSTGNERTKAQRAGNGTY